MHMVHLALPDSWLRRQESCLHCLAPVQLQSRHIFLPWSKLHLIVFWLSSWLYLPFRATPVGAVHWYCHDELSEALVCDSLDWVPQVSPQPLLCFILMHNPFADLMANYSQRIFTLFPTAFPRALLLHSFNLMRDICNEMDSFNR